MIKYSKESFFSKTPCGNLSEEFKELLDERIKSKGNLIFDFCSSGAIEVSVGLEKLEDAVSLQGNEPKSTKYFKNKAMVSNKFVPLLWNIKKVIISYKNVYLYSINGRSIGEFLIRNLLMNIILNTKISHMKDVGVGSLYIDHFMDDYDKYIKRDIKNRQSTDSPQEFLFADFIFECLDLNNINLGAGNIFSNGFENKEGKLLVKASTLAHVLSNRENVIRVCYG